MTRSSTPPFSPGLCANCDGRGVTVKSPIYCSPLCRQVAELVRYVRGCRADGRDQRPDVDEAIRTKLALVLGGGYPDERRQVPAEVRALVFERAGGRCEECGRVLDFDHTSGDPDAIATIQHVTGSSNDPSNLKAFCRRCNLADAQSRFVPVQPDSPQAAMLAGLIRRWSSPAPLRICDDHERWRYIWRDLSRQALAALPEPPYVPPDDVYGDEDLPGFQGWTEQGTPIQDI